MHSQDLLFPSVFCAPGEEFRQLSSVVFRSSPVSLIAPQHGFKKETFLPFVLPSTMGLVGVANNSALVPIFLAWSMPAAAFKIWLLHRKIKSFCTKELK